MRRLITFAVIAALSACRGGDDLPDAGQPPIDAGRIEVDAGFDAGLPDAGQPDVDAGVDAGTPDTVAPEVVQTTPTTASTNVAVTTTFVITFSEPIRPASLTILAAPDITFAGPSWNTDGSVVTLSHAAPLSFGTDYALSILASDLAGNAMGAPYQLRVRTEAMPDTTAPTLDATLPTNGATTVPTSTGFTLTFSETMDRSTVTATATPGVTFAAPQWTTNDTQLTLTPSPALNANQGYAVLVAGKDVAGNALTGTASFAFTTAPPPDTTPPTLISSTPANAATNVIATTRLALTFSEPMSTGSVTVTPSPASNLGSPTWSNGDKTLTFAASEDWDFGAHVVIAVSGTDRAGNPLAATLVTFDTALPPDTTRPTVTSTVPVNGNQSVPTQSTIEWNFSEPMQQAATQAAVTITPSVSCAFTWNAARTLLVCSHSTPLTASQAYSVTLGTGAKDDANNTLATAHAFVFTTAAAPDTTPPTVTATVPTANAKSVQPTVTGGRTPSRIVVTFSEAMRQSDTQSAFRITAPGGVTGGTFAWNAAGTQMAWTPGSAFALGTLVTFEVGTGASDLAGNHLASAYSSSFTIVRRASVQLWSSGNTHPAGVGSALDGTIIGLANCSGTPAVGASLPLAYAGDFYSRTTAGIVYRGYLTFSISALATYPNAVVRGASLYVNQISCGGEPFGSSFGGAINALHVNYGTSLDAADCSTPTLDGPYPMSIDATLGWKAQTVTTAVADDFANLSTRGGRSQFELVTATVLNDGDTTTDACQFGTFNQTDDALDPYLLVTVEYD